MGTKFQCQRVKSSPLLKKSKGKAVLIYGCGGGKFLISTLDVNCQLRILAIMQLGKEHPVSIKCDA
jgi:hypothetical protein